MELRHLSFNASISKIKVKGIAAFLASVWAIWKGIICFIKDAVFVLLFTVDYVNKITRYMTNILQLWSISSQEKYSNKILRILFLTAENVEVHNSLTTKFIQLSTSDWIAINRPSNLMIWWMSRVSVLRKKNFSCTQYWANQLNMVRICRWRFQ